MNFRIRKLYLELQKCRLQGLLVSSQANITYLSGYPGRDSYLLASPAGNILFTDSRYILHARSKLGRAVRAQRADGDMLEAVGRACAKLRIRRLGIEERHLSCAEFRRMRHTFPSGTKFSSFGKAIEEMRQIKTPGEIAKIRKANSITIAALKSVRKFIKPGMRETEVAAHLEHAIRLGGAHTSAFNLIIASGPNSCHPHHITSHRKLKNNEPVLIDIGVDYFGYKSDLTRVFFLGKITSLMRRVYDAVCEANRLSIARVAAGVPIKDIDACARRHLARLGLAKYFKHSLGHGVGLEIHEAPRISPAEKGRLKSGMVFTVEPAVYLPGKFGIRIEDMVLVKNSACEVLSGSFNK